MQEVFDLIIGVMPIAGPVSVALASVIDLPTSDGIRIRPFDTVRFTSVPAGTSVATVGIVETIPSFGASAEGTLLVVPIARPALVRAVVAAANDSEYGLAASVWTESLSHAHRLSSDIRAGTVWINSHGGVHPMIPFGGAKQSGYGLEFGVEGLKALGVPQIISG